MNREIVKLQNYFDNLNLRNEINIKNTMKKIDNMKFKNWKPSLKRNDDKINLCLNDVNVEDENFRINGNLRKHINSFKNVVQGCHTGKKEKTKRFTHQAENFAMSYKINGHINKEKIDTNDFKQINFLNEDCIENIDLDLNCNFCTENHCLIKNGDSCNIPKPEKELNEFRTDLQSLLIMMAINSKASDSEEHKDCLENNITPIANRCNEINPPTENIERSGAKISELLCVIPLRTEEQNRYHFLSNKVIKKWKSYVLNKREIREREAVLNNFFEKLAAKKNTGNQPADSVRKAKLHIKDYNKYQHRYKVQQNIIALQKMKLEEQTKIIEQLKYNKILESSKEALEALREDVSKTYYQIDPQLKPKIKCLTNELKIRELDEPALVLHCLKVPQFIQRMEKRAREREEKHAMIREKRRQMEEERIRLKQQSELAKLEMDKEEKAKRIKELREKRKREKIENIRRKQHVERMRALAVMAELHYEKNLMAKYGLNPFKRLIEIKQDNIEKAKSHYLFQLKKNVFLHWMWHTEDMWFERNYKAETFCRKKILSRAFDGFKQNYHSFKLKIQVAEDYYDLYVTQLVFRKFREGIQITRNETKIKWNKAVLYHNSCLSFKIFTCWRTLPALNALKREQELRKLRWREKVLQVVPDYNPPDE